MHLMATNTKGEVGQDCRRVPIAVRTAPTVQPMAGCGTSPYTSLPRSSDLHSV